MIRPKKRLLRILLLTIVSIVVVAICIHEHKIHTTYHSASNNNTSPSEGLPQRLSSQKLSTTALRGSKTARARTLPWSRFNKKDKHALQDKPEHRLTRELIESRSQEGYLFLTAANHQWIDFAVTWATSLTKVGVHGYLVGAMEPQVYRALVSRGIATWLMDTDTTEHDQAWGSPGFHRIGRVRSAMLQSVMAMTDRRVVFCDIDIAWVRNPIPFFQRYPEADLLIHSDATTATVRTEDLERFPEVGIDFNMGLMVFKPSCKPLVDAWVAALQADDKLWDQASIQELIRNGTTISNARGMFKGFHEQMLVGVLPVALFCSGHTGFVQRKYQEFGLRPYMYHTTFQYSYVPGKRNRLREFMLFEDPPEYYDHPAGFIKLSVPLPYDLVQASKGHEGATTPDKVANHFALVHHQLLFIRAGMALAQTTGRALIMPPLLCELDRFWDSMTSGTLPGADFHRPFICPLDYVLEIETGLTAIKDVNVYGPHIDWREHSFLHNPRLPSSVYTSRVTVSVCNSEDMIQNNACANGTMPATVEGGQAVLCPGQTDELIKVSLMDTATYKILEVNGEDILSMWPPFSEEGGWFSDTDNHIHFVNRLKEMASYLQGLVSDPNYVWYDLLWDVPHTDINGRKYETWEMRLGNEDKPALQQVPDVVVTSGDVNVADVVADALNDGLSNGISRVDQQAAIDGEAGAAEVVALASFKDPTASSSSSIIDNASPIDVKVFASSPPANASSSSTSTSAHAAGKSLNSDSDDVRQVMTRRSPSMLSTIITEKGSVKQSVLTPPPATGAASQIVFPTASKTASRRASPPENNSNIISDGSGTRAASVAANSELTDKVPYNSTTFPAAKQHHPQGEQAVNGSVSHKSESQLQREQQQVQQLYYHGSHHDHHNKEQVPVKQQQQDKGGATTKAVVKPAQDETPTAAAASTGTGHKKKTKKKRSTAQRAAVHTGKDALQKQVSVSSNSDVNIKDNTATN